MHEELPIGPNPCCACGLEYGEHLSDCAGNIQTEKIMSEENDLWNLTSQELPPVGILVLTSHVLPFGGSMTTKSSKSN